MLSYYRLGDLVIQELSQDDKQKILINNPNTFGSNFILEYYNNNYNNSKINIFSKIVLDNIDNYKDFYPDNIENSTLIHVRLGDVVSGNLLEHLIKRPFEVEYIKSLLKNDFNNKYVMGKCFFPYEESLNYEESINKSNSYLQNVINELGATYFSSGNADIDLCCAIKAKLFVQGRGFYSKLIVEVRKHLNLPCIEVDVFDQELKNNFFS